MKMKSSVRLLNHIIKIMNLQQSLIIRDEQWNQSYEAYNFNINGYVFKSRLAKKTTKKKGYFLSLWEKDKTKKNRAFDYESFPGKLTVHVMDDSQVGQFIFPKHVLFHKGILRNHASKGKMAFRVYPTWEKDLNRVAHKTQEWQKQYFIDMSQTIDVPSIKRAYFNED